MQEKNFLFAFNKITMINVVILLRPLERPRRRVRDNNSSEERRGDEPPRYRTRQNSTEERPGDETRYRGLVNDMSDVRRGHLSPEFPEMLPSINCNECPLKFTSIQVEF